MYPICNYNWRNISTIYIYIYNKTNIKRNILTTKQNTSGSRSGKGLISTPVLAMLRLCVKNLYFDTFFFSCFPHDGKKMILHTIQRNPTCLSEEYNLLLHIACPKSTRCHRRLEHRAAVAVTDAHRSE